MLPSQPLQKQVLLDPWQKEGAEAQSGLGSSPTQFSELGSASEVHVSAADTHVTSRSHRGRTELPGSLLYLAGDLPHPIRSVCRTQQTSACSRGWSLTAEAKQQGVSSPCP